MDKKYSMNKVDGFNPFDYLETALDRTGEPILKKDGTELKYLSTAAKSFWFRKVHPEGRISVEPVETKEVDTLGVLVCYRARVFFNVKDEAPAAEWEHQETCWDIADLDKAVSRCQTIALGKALSKAGFGCEVELLLNIGSEGENPETEKEPPKAIKLKKPVVKNEEVTSEEIDDLLRNIDSLEEKADEEEQTDYLDEALKTVLKCTDSAPVNIKKLEGQTLEEIMAAYPTFINMVNTKKNVREAVTEEVRLAAKFIAENL